MAEKGTESPATATIADPAQEAVGQPTARQEAAEPQRNGVTGKRHIPTAAQIQAAPDLRVVDVPVPEWGPGAVIPVISLTGAERDAYEASITETKGESQQIRIRNARAKMVVLAAVDDDRRRLFTDDDLGWIAQKSAAALGRIFDKARELAGMSKEDIEELEEQLGKDRSA